jgi:hypothetical protein
MAVEEQDPMVVQNAQRQIVAVEEQDTLVVQDGQWNPTNFGEWAKEKNFCKVGDEAVIIIK